MLYEVITLGAGELGGGGGSGDGGVVGFEFLGTFERCRTIVFALQVSIQVGEVDVGNRQVGLAAVISSSMLQALDYPRRMYPQLGELPLIVPILAAMVVCGLIGLLT